jgi:hypothetical protein
MAKPESDDKLPKVTMLKVGNPYLKVVTILSRFQDSVPVCIFHLFIKWPIETSHPGSACWHDVDNNMSFEKIHPLGVDLHQMIDILYTKKIF